MRRMATLMVLREGMEQEYQRRHREVWPEILSGIQRAGIRNYSIFMLGRQVFSYFEVDDLEAAMQVVAADPVNQAWQEQMAPLMEVASGIKDGSTIYLEEIFHID